MVVVEVKVALEGRGLAGVVAPARQARYPSWVSERFRRGGPVLTAFLGLELTPEVLALRSEGAGAPRLGLSVEAFERVAETAVAWTAEAGEGTEVILERDMFVGAAVRGDAEEYARAAERSTLARLVRFTRRPRRLRLAATDGQGTLIYQMIDDEAGWQACLDGLVQVLRVLGPFTDVGAVRHTTLFCWGWDGAKGRPPASPHGLDFVMDQRPGLRRSWVADAYGVQVLTDEHLSRVRDLSAWSVEDLGNGRHLVTHRDPAAWYAQAVPDPVVLDAARRDFGPILVTREAAAAHQRRLASRPRDA